ncbi:MAG: ACT domain-containing protein [Ruminococcaceae bacterium]|nr:ACT domain-containing protein [Oscillospiraceae bacterium]
MEETGGTPRLLVVDTRALPEVFERVLTAKRLLTTGEATSASEAARQAGISRTAFYKYRDMVFPYDVSAAAGDLMTVHFLLNDRPGVLSALLTAFAEAGANILTVNQNIPVGGAASVSVTARCDRLGVSSEGLLVKLSGVAGVKRILRINSE